MGHETEFFLLFREIYWNFVDTVIKRIGQVSRVPWYSGYRKYLFNAINITNRYYTFDICYIRFLYYRMKFKFRTNA